MSQKTQENELKIAKNDESMQEVNAIMQVSHIPLLQKICKEKMIVFYNPNWPTRARNILMKRKDKNRQIYFQQNERTNNYLKPLINKGAKNTISVSDENAINGIVIFPSKKVQVKIGYFLNKIDELVELYDKKVEKLAKIKKAFLEQMFA